MNDMYNAMRSVSVKRLSAPMEKSLRNRKTLTHDELSVQQINSLLFPWLLTSRIDSVQHVLDTAANQARQ